MKNTSDTIGNRTRDLPAYGTAPPRAPVNPGTVENFRSTVLQYYGAV